MKTLPLSLAVVLLYSFAFSLPVSAQWIIERVDSLSSVGQYSSLAVDDSGHPHIGYLDITGTALKYAYNDGSVWTTEIVDSASIVGRFCDIALDSAGNPHVTYYDNTAFMYGLKYAHKDSSGWTIETAVSDAELYSASIALDASGSPHIGFAEVVGMGDIDVRYARRIGFDDWIVESADPLGDADPSIAIDTAGYPHISYYGQDVGLRYAYRDSSGWHTQVVDGGDTGRYTSLVLDADGYPRISYFSFGDGALMYAYWAGSAWGFETVDDAGNVGQYSSMALDAAGHPHIAYYGVTNGDLKYAYRTSSGWQIEVVESVADVGLYSSLALHDGRVPHIAYYDNWYGDLKYAYLDFHDVTLLSLDSPPDRVCIDSVYTPCVTVRNLGTCTETFDVTIALDGYSDLFTVVDLTAGDSTQVCFADWTVPSTPDSAYGILVCTHATDDRNPSNDCAYDTIFSWDCVDRHDCGVVSIDYPQDTVCFGGIYAPCATLHNFGNRIETFDAVLTIDSYAETLQVTGFVPGDSERVCFSDWAVPITSDTNYVLTVCTHVPGDTILANDCAFESLFAHQCVLHDLGIISSTVPDTVCIDQSYPVCVKVRNMGTAVDTFDVIHYRESLVDTLFGVILASKDTTDVCFTDWTPLVPDTLVGVGFTVDHVLDMNPDNNNLSLEVWTRICPGAWEEMRTDAEQSGWDFEISPNPLVRQTAVVYRAPVHTELSIKIYDIKGSRVRTILEGDCSPGVHRVCWDGRNDRGVLAPSGVYFCHLEACPGPGEGQSRRAGTLVKTRKMILID